MSGREVSWRERIISAGADPAPLHPEVFGFMSVFVFVSVFVHSSVFVAVIIVLSLCVCVLPDQNISGRAHIPTTRPPSISDSWPLKLTVVVVFRINLCLYFCLNWFVFVFWGGSIGSMLGCWDPAPNASCSEADNYICIFYVQLYLHLYRHLYVHLVHPT